MHVTYGRERNKTACRATAHMSLELGTPRAGRRSTLVAYIITAGGKELCAIVLIGLAGVPTCRSVPVPDAQLVSSPTHKGWVSEP